MSCSAMHATLLPTACHVLPCNPEHVTAQQPPELSAHTCVTLTGYMHVMVLQHVSVCPCLHLRLVLCMVCEVLLIDMRSATDIDFTSVAQSLSLMSVAQSVSFITLVYIVFRSNTGLLCLMSQARVREELSEAGLAATPDHPAPGPWTLQICLLNLQLHHSPQVLLSALCRSTCCSSLFASCTTATPFCPSALRLARQP